MHIAICDDNIADRKQLERLLKRESDKRAANTGVLYIDAYGNIEALLKSPMLYDIFFIDMTAGKANGIDVVNALRELGVNAPIVLCSSKINYRSLITSDHGQILHLDKAIKVAELANIIDCAISMKGSSSPLIELRPEQGTYYVTEPDILYAITKGRYMIVTLQNQKKVSILSSLGNLFGSLEVYPSFFCPNSHAIINGRYLDKLSLFSVTMQDKKKFFLSPAFHSYAKYIFETHAK